jgi:hypothetical protein
MILKGGLQIGIIEDYPSDSDMGHVAKVRVFVPHSRDSVVGYVLRLNQ